MNTIDNRSIRSLIMATTLSIGLGFVTHASAESYLIDLKSKTALDLGNVDATAINNAGQVVGYSGDSISSRAFITGPNGVGMTDLGMLPGEGATYAYGINTIGQVVGYSAMTDGQTHAFITGPNGVGMTDLGMLPGRNGSSASGINDAGQVVGYSYTGKAEDAQYHAFVTGPNGVGMTDLGTLPGGDYSQASAINNAGQVTGSSNVTNNSFTVPFITGPNGTGMTNIDPSVDYGEASGINNTGQVVGSANNSFTTVDAFITGPNGVGRTDLGTLGGIGSSASGINDAGQVVGGSFIAVGGDNLQPYDASHAFITGPNGTDMTDLNSLVYLPGGFVMVDAVAINNMGQILVSAEIPFIPAVPEPESYALMLAGLVLTGVMVRRKQKADAGTQLTLPLPVAARYRLSGQD